MSLITGYVKDLDLRLPLLRRIEFTDPRTGDVHDGWLIAVKKLTLEQRAVIYKDCQARIEAEFWKEVLVYGLPIRAERVIVAMESRGFV